MSTQDLEDSHRMLRALKAVADQAHFTADGRQTDVGGHASPLDALLDEIRDTLLARELVFQNDAGHVLALEIAERRVLRISRMDGSFKTDLPAGSRVSAEQLGALVALLSDFCQRTRSLFIRSEFLENRDCGSEMGLAAETIAEAARQVIASSIEDTDRDFSRFFASCQGLAQAAVVEGQHPTAWGSEQAVNDLGAILSAISIQDGQIDLWVAEDQAVFCAGIGSDRLCGSCAAQDSWQILRAWQDLTT